MAEVQCDVIQPSLRPRRASARRKGVASVENVSKDENLASVQWTVLNTENKKWYKKNKKKKRQEVAAAVGATISAATAAPQECGHAKSAGGAGSSGATTYQEGAQASSAGGAGRSGAAARQKSAQSRSAGGAGNSGAAVPQKRAHTRPAGGAGTSGAATHQEVAHARSSGGSGAAAHQEGAQATSAGGAGSSGVADSQEGFQVRSAGAPPAAVVLDPQQKYVLEQNYIFLLEKKSARNPQAQFHCKLCKYHCDSVAFAEKHIHDKRHHKLIEEEAERVTLLNLPPATPEQLKYLTNLLKEEVERHGLSDTDILARQNITTVLGKALAEIVPGSTVRLYGSSATGFGLKQSDVNLELCVPPDKSPAKGLATAYDFIGSQEIYSKVEHEFTAEIPAVRFVDSDTNLPCTLMLCNSHSYKTSVLLSKYASINERVRTLGIAFRLWGQHCRLDNADAGMWPPYAFPLLLVYFLQQLREPVLPVLHELGDTPDVENEPDIYLDPKNLEGIWTSVNAMSLGELWLELFRFYALDFDMVGRVACIEQSNPLLRSSNEKRWLGKKIAVRDPFLPKRNVARSMSTQACFEYCMTCFRNTYKYFRVLHTKTGPIFDKIVLNAPEKLASLCKEMGIVDNAVNNGTNNHPHVSTEGTTVIRASDVEKKLQKTSPTVSVEKAREMFSSFNGANLYYEFRGQNFVGNQKCPEICSVCLKDGHSKDKCKTQQLTKFDVTLPPLDMYYKDVMDKLCAHVLEKWAVTPEEVEKRKRIVSEIQEYVLRYFPTVKLELFGSSYNGFGLLKSDIDICLTFTDSETGKEHDFVKVIEDLQEKLKKFCELSNLVPVTTAKVPILKFYHIQSEFEGDISIYNTLGQQNTKLLRTYAEVDLRAKMLGYMIKRFAKVCDMCDASRGSLSSYAYILMVIYFLQQCSPPVLPVLQELSGTQTKPQRLVEDCDTYFYDDLSNLEKVWPGYGKNTSTVGELWIQLLRFYGAEFDFEKHVISIRQSAPLLRFEKLWTSKCMAIEDPFDLSHNLGVGLSRNMHVYIISSFRKGYLHFGKPAAETALVAGNPEAYYFQPEKLTNGKLPNDRGCRICKKIGHIMRDCPQRKQGRNKSGQRGGVGGGGAGIGRRHPQPQLVQNVGTMRNLNPTNSPVRGYNPSFRFPHNSMYGSQANQGRFRNPGEFPPHRWRSNYMPGNLKSQDNSNMRYGMPQVVPPPFKSQAPVVDMNRKIGVPGLPPFGRIQGNMRPVSRHEQVNLTGLQLPVDTYAETRPERHFQECYEMAHRLGLIQNRNLNRGLNHLKPKGEIHCVPKVPSDVVVVDVFPPGRR